MAPCCPRCPEAGTAVTYTISTIKGIDYASFPAAGGAYTATYAAAAAPAINGLQATAAPDESAATASIAWSTSEPMTSEVALGTTPDALVTKQAQAGSSREHSLDVTGLAGGTTYYYRVTSKDAAGHQKTDPAVGSPPASFTTPAADVTKPTATAPVVTPLPDGTAQVAWRTDQPADSLVRFGSSADNLNGVRIDPALVQDHRVVVTGLQPSQTYWVGTTSTRTRPATRRPARPCNSPRRGRALPSRRRPVSVADKRLGRRRSEPAVSAASPWPTTPVGRTENAATGGFNSGVVDAQAIVGRDRVMLRGPMCRAVALTVRVRTGSTAVPDGDWSSWRTVADGDRVGKGSRYIQYRGRS